jgi:hypothetical protein
MEPLEARYQMLGGGLVGWGVLGPLLRGCGVLEGWEGYHHYAEAHLSEWNAWIHFLCMPFTIHGLYLGIPALLKMTQENAHLLQRATFGMFIGYVASYDLWGSVFLAAHYTVPVSLAIERYRNEGSVAQSGIKISVCALLLQESIGHYGGGDIPSRAGSVPNAILFAMHFTGRHIANVFGF